MTLTFAQYPLLISLLFTSLSTIFAISLPPPSSVGSDLDWKTAVHRGTTLYQQLESGCYPDVVNPITRDQLLAIGFEFGDDEASTWPPIFNTQRVFDEAVVKAMKWTIGKDYWTSSCKRYFFYPFKDRTYYYNTYSPKNGLIATFEDKNVRAAAETITWPDLTFAIWQAIAVYSKSNIKNVRYIGQQRIVDEFTMSIISRIVGPSISDAIIFQPNTESFLAFLGTPVGGATVYFLMQHKRALGRKRISKITLFPKTRNHWRQNPPDLVFEVRDMVSLGLEASAIGNATTPDTGTSSCLELNNATAALLRDS